ncbi:GLPGLI family protein [Chryseobacterium sp. MYb264]|uniref:GLPGLI family protein n=1 Tax=Chryseobacterium sp. MYb264 TaxID=2745153 RepID=UPI002E1087AE|nr:GLPGLI family protein [Chryseobacterium sp. MYb264]
MYRLLFFLLASFFSAQNYRFVYEYKMKPDISKNDSLITDFMNLDSDGKQSFFYNAVKYERDSTYRADQNYGQLLTSKKYDRNLGYIIEKDYAKKRMNFYDKYKNVQLMIPDSDIPKWEIKKEFSTINTLNCQKATTFYKGRNWEAWFSKDYPISDGPYKFTGLPGLIVKMKDTNSDHEFNLIQIKKVKNIFSFVPKNTKLLTYKDYKKYLANDSGNINDDIESLNMNSKDDTIGIHLKDGFIGTFNMNELKKSKDFDAALSKKLQRTNNPIEKDIQ